MTDPSLASATGYALELALRVDHTERHHALRNAMRALCADARRQGLRPEELIVLLKETWRTRPELRTMPPEEAGSLMDQVVTMCIQEYYSGG
jgi:hypothetical protein